MTRFALSLLKSAEFVVDHGSCAYSATVDGDPCASPANKAKWFLTTESLIVDPKSTATPLMIVYVHFLSLSSSSSPTFFGSQLTRLSYARELARLVDPIHVNSTHVDVTTTTIVYAKKLNKHEKYVTSNGLVRLKLTAVHCSFDASLFQELHRVSGLPTAREEIRRIVDDMQRIPFDSSRLIDFRENADALAPDDVVNVHMLQDLSKLPGTLCVTDARVYFQPSKLNNLESSMRVRSWALGKEVVDARPMRYLMEKNALELVVKGNNVFFVFEGNKVDATTNANVSLRDAAVERILAHLRDKGVDVEASKSARLHKALTSWRKREMDTYTYLSVLNQEADRSRCNLSSYPVFPWIVQDYTSDELDLTHPDTFRDLHKPVGALNVDRLSKFRERYAEMLEMEDVVPFLYGTHYSAPAYVLFFLLRSRPDLTLKLQNGNFDHPDRLFTSVKETYESVTTHSSDVKELVPQFFDLDSTERFLTNSNNTNFGALQQGTRVGDVVLPPWANNSPKIFIEQNRKALESEYVSNNIHNWIDLIFGVKQRDPLADNVFYHVTYQEEIDKRLDSNGRVPEGVRAQLQEFGACAHTHSHIAHMNATLTHIHTTGVTPTRLFSSPHPKRSEARILREPSATLLRGTSTVSSSSSISTVAVQSRPSWAFSSTKLIDSGENALHRGEITSLTLLSSRLLLSSSLDGCLAVFDVETCKTTRRTKIGRLGLTSVDVLDPQNDRGLTSSCANVLLGSQDDALYVYSLEYGRVVRRVGDEAHEAEITAVSVSTLASLAASASADSTCLLWSVRNGKLSDKKPVSGVFDHEFPLSTVEFSPFDDRSLVIGDVNGGINLYDVRKLKESFASSRHPGKEVVSTAYASPTQVLYVALGEGVYALENDESKLVVDAADARRIACDADGRVALIDSAGLRVERGQDVFSAHSNLLHESSLVCRVQSDASAYALGEARVVVGTTSGVVTSYSSP